MEILYLIIGIAAGFAVGYLLLRNQSASKISEMLSQRNVADERVRNLSDQNEKLGAESNQQHQQILQLTSENAFSKNELVNLQKQLTEQKTEFENLQERFTKEFENLANRIFDEKGKTFADQNKKNLDQLLNPFQEKIKDFERKVENAYVNEMREKASLKTEIKNLFDLNKQLSEEANNLTKALKGDSRQQGSWGELMLEKILEKSGLVKDREYKMQVSTVNADGRTIQPDAIIFLPDQKHIIIDSKVSLVAYEQAVNATNDVDRTRFLKEHLQSIRVHVKQLGDKKYYTAQGTNSPDFVFLFLWSEAAFSAALQVDSDLFNYAWERKIAIVSPTTIWANLKTIANLWRIENQNKNAEEIARQGADLYDKFVGFMEDMVSLGKKLDDSKKSYEESMKKLSTGTGNLIRRTEKMKDLGLKSTKSIPQSLIDRAEE